MPGLLAGMTIHATGVASVVGSMASARSLDFHSGKTHLVSGAEAGADVCLIRRGRGAVSPVAEPLAGWILRRTAENPSREGEFGGDGGLASALGGYGSERPKDESFGLPPR